MPRAIADSDDEEDDLFAERNVVSNGALKSESVSRINDEVAVDGLDESNAQSTDSTELLRRQIESAERGLLTNSAPEIVPRDRLISSDSPSVRKHKRRNTEPVSEANPGSQRSVKRTKTTHTYGSKRQSRIPDDDANFGRLLDDDAMPGTSQSARFTEHSGVHSSAAIPSGPIHEDFLGHEPNLMFRDSGSTTADTSSANQRLLEQIRPEKFGPSTSMTADAISDEQHNSSMPWSTLDQHGKANVGSQRGPPQVGTVATNHNVIEAVNESVEDYPRQHAPENARQLQPPAIDESPSKARTQASQTGSDSNIALSPAVEIPREKAPKTRPGPEADIATKKPPRLGRMRKAKDTNKAEPLVSDDRPVGLPEEQYKPRLSKTRSTQTAEELIDYSIMPEKALKAKKTKKANAGTDAGPEIIDQAKDVISPPASVERSTQKLKTALKPKPSQTSVFEDEVEASGSQGVTDLSQTQVKKSNPLQNVQNEAKFSTQRKRRNVILDDEDEDEDDGDEKNDKSESVNEPAPAQEDNTAPKKRGRGRPPKSTMKAQADVVDEVSTVSGGNAEGRPAPKDGPKKGGRERPSKRAEASKSTAGLDDPTNRSVSGNEAMHDAPGIPSNSSTASVKKAASEVTDTNQSSEQLPTPSKEKSNTSKDAKANPTSHSSVAKLPNIQYRVGLSQRARIPRLHSNIKPRNR